MGTLENFEMKVSREQMAGNRRRILDAASRLFRDKGFDAVSVAEVMKAAGLTHGGFYGHFSSKDDLIAEKYRGIRPAFGYPACPDHTPKRTLFDLLDAPSIGMELTESFAMTPTAAVAGLYFAHPDSRYFMVGKVGRDQVTDYARRTSMPLAEAERWLRPILGYEEDAQ